MELALVNEDISQTARDLRWIKATFASGSMLSGTPIRHLIQEAPRDQELADLKKKLYTLEQENAIFKKAVGIFAPRSR